LSEEARPEDAVTSVRREFIDSTLVAAAYNAERMIRIAAIALILFFLAMAENTIIIKEMYETREKVNKVAMIIVIEILVELYFFTSLMFSSLYIDSAVAGRRYIPSSAGSDAIDVARKRPPEYEEFLFSERALNMSFTKFSPAKSPET